MPRAAAPKLAIHRGGPPKTRTTPRPKPKKIAEARARGFDTGTVSAAMRISEDKPLTKQQWAFVREWAKGETISNASARAGYGDGGTFAYRMVHMPNILKVYNEEKAKYEAAAGMTRKKVMDGLMEAVEMAKMAGEPSAMVAGWREIGKMCGYYEPVTRKLDITVNGNVVMERMNRMSDAELLKLIEEGVNTEVQQLELEEQEQDA